MCGRSQGVNYYQALLVGKELVITLVSGAIGLVCGTGLCLLLRNLPLPDFVPHPAISAAAITSSLLTLAAITIFAGTYPAMRAANLTPMECLRTD